MANELINVITDHSINKSRITIPDLVEFANTLQASTIIITDYDTVSGAAELISLCSKSGIKSSVGVKIRMQYDDIEGYTALIAKNYKGYIAIGKALRDSSNGRNNPLMDKSVFEKCFGVGSVGHDNVIVTTSGIDGLIFKMTEQDSYPVVSALEYFIGVVGRDNFFVEMQFHGYLVEQKIYPYLAEIADSLNINLLATNDPVFIHGDNDDVLLDILKYANDRKVPSVSSARHYYVKNHEQLKETLTPILYESQVDKAVVNIEKLASVCDLIIPDAKHYPTYNTDGLETAGQILRDRVIQGVCDRSLKMTAEYEYRLEYELEIIIGLGLADYILIITDLVKYIQGKGREKFGECCVTKGPGRGGAVGSIVCYVLGITDVDPIKYKLIFERFLNPARKTMPDIDIDINPQILNDALAYLKNTYGDNAISGLLSFNRHMSKSAISLSGKYLERKHDDSSYRALSEKMSNSCKNSSVIQENRNELITFLKNDKKAIEILKTAKLVENSIDSGTRHPSGILISDRNDLSDLVPVKYAVDKSITIAECTANEAEKIYHLLKIDFLNLQTLDTVSSVLTLIKDSEKTIIDFDSIPLEESVFREVFSKGNTELIFQFGSHQARKILKIVKPSTINDLMFVLALDRAGSSDFINKSLESVKNKRKPDYYIPQLDSITQDTYGFIIYQEQVIQIFTNLSGYSIEEADIIRAAISKKKKEIIAAEHDRFVIGCKNNGISDDDAEKIYNQILSFGSYFFNKSHAAAYAVLSYRIGWLFYHYPKQFLLTFQAKEKKTNTYLKYCVSNNIAIIKPDINSAASYDQITPDGIMVGFASVKGVGPLGRQIEQERLLNGSFVDIVDFAVRIKPNEIALKSLALCGAFNSLSVMGYAIAENCERITAISTQLIHLYEKLQNETNTSEKIIYRTSFSELKAQVLSLSTEKTDTSLASIIKTEIDLMGVASSDFLDMYGYIIEDNSDVRICDITEGNHRLCGVVLNIVEKSKEDNGALYADLLFFDGSGLIDCRISSYDYPGLKSAIKNKALLCIIGYFQVTEYGKETFWIKDSIAVNMD